MLNITDFQSVDSTVAIVFLLVVLVLAGIKFIEWLLPNGKKKDNGKKHETPCPKLVEVSTLFGAHEKMQTETMATIHNGLNTNANAVKDISEALKKNTTAVAVLTAIINERIPSKNK